MAHSFWTLLAISERGVHTIGGDPRHLLDAGCRVLALKRGAKGCRILTRDEDVTVPAAVLDVVDTTGAEDSFAAGAILAVLEGVDAATIGARANYAGARAASTRGAGQALFAE
jgi:sugar/nucleoside kinase (ribokinase family)